MGGQAHFEHVTLCTAPVGLALFDVLGREVRTLFDGPAAGRLVVPLDGRDLPAGVYVVRAVVRHAAGPATVQTRTFTLTR